MAEAEQMNGAEWLARALASTGMKHVFFVEVGDAPHLAAIDRSRRQAGAGPFGKGGAYMADGYARVARRPGICMAQSVGAANLASGFAGCLAWADPGHRPDRP